MNKLITKINHIPKENFVDFKKVTKSVKMPFKTKTFDFVRVAKDFSDMDILTFRDKSGKVLKKVFLEDDTVTERTYIPLKKSVVLVGSILPVIGRKISTIIKNKNELIQKSEEIQAVTIKEDGKPVLNISKVEAAPMSFAGMFLESQSLHQYEADKPVKGYTIYGYARSGLGQDFLNERPDFIFKNIDLETQKKLTKDIYFPLHLYSYKHFKQTAPNTAVRPGRSVLPQKIHWISDNVKDRNGYFDGTQINLNKKLVNNRFEIINISAHEREHVYQADQVRRLNAQERNSRKIQHIIKILEKKGRKFIDNRLKAAIYREEFKNYIDASKDRQAYRQQLIEKEASLAGALAEREYRKSAQMLKDEFPYAPDYMIGFSNKDLKTS